MMGDLALAPLAIVASILALSVSTGLILMILLQPHRERANYSLILFLGSLAVWASGSLLRNMPAVAEIFPTTVASYVLASGMGASGVALYLFTTHFCEIDTRLSRLLTQVALVTLAATLALIWTGNMFADIKPLAVGEQSFVIQPVGWVGLIATSAYAAIALFCQWLSGGERARRLMVPTALVLAGYGTNVIHDLAQSPIDILLATVAAFLMGRAALHFQLFSPLADANQQLRVADQNLRQAIGELRAERDKVQTLSEELRAASRYKSEFLTNMSHELRTPLNSIVGYSELVLDGIYGELTEAQRDRLERILRNGRNLLGLINDILDLSRIDAGQLELTLTNVRVAEALRLAVASVEHQARAKGLPIHVEVEGNPPNLRADELRLRQIIVNLLDNAVKFTQEGSIAAWAGHVHIAGLGDQRFPKLRLGDWLVVRVTDTGIGIPPESHHIIFEDFAQADTSPTRAHEGGGLGLTITRRLVELHGGAIWAESQPGRGSTFSFGIPYTAPDETLVQYETESMPQPERPMILVVDDEAEALEILNNYLSPAGYAVVNAHGGQQALQLARQLRPDLITLDILMPDLDGWQVLERLRSDPATNDIPVVTVSIIDQEPRALQMGVAEHIAKPVDRAALLRAVSKAVATKPILIAGEDPNDREIFTRVLRTTGRQVMAVESAEAAITWLRDRQAALVLLDLKNPSVDGLKVLDFMLQYRPTAQTPTLVIWPDELIDEEKQSLHRDWVQVLRKRGLAQATLLETVTRTLERHEA
jgi:signal transduction histidine kinase/CheY-like chemotaxis protein